MEAASWGFIGTVVGAIVGASASVATTTITSWNAFRLQKGANALERAERARAFQRENFLNTQETLQDLMRLMGRAHLADLAAYREKGEWGKNMLGDEINENLHLSNRKMSVLVERVTDDSLRGKLKEIHVKITDVYSAKSINEAQKNFRNLAPTYKKGMEHLGSVLRNNY